LAEAPFTAADDGAVEALRTSCRQRGGLLTILQAPPEDRLPAWHDAPSRSLIEAVKRQFDPLGQLAPGRLPGVQPPSAATV
jgi:glycolate oxidase FAD binding subunit